MGELLLVDDDGFLVASVVRGLANEWSVVHCATPQQALQWLRVQRPDLVILDVELQAQLDGFSLCRLLRQGGWAGNFTYQPPAVPIPILMLTSRDHVDDRVRGLNEGADDYLSKPFNIHELRARLHALTRRYAATRSNARAPEVVRLGEFTLFPPPERRLVSSAMEIELTETEFDLLYWLALHPNEWHSRETLLEHVWQAPGQISTRTVDVFVGRLRKKLTVDGDGSLIQTKYGSGYRLDR